MVRSMRLELTRECYHYSHSLRLSVYLFRHDLIMVDPAGLEPATNRLWADDSDQLS